MFSLFETVCSLFLKYLHFFPINVIIYYAIFLAGTGTKTEKRGIIMENYTLYLPLYGEVSSHFKNFVSEMATSPYLSKYLVQFDQDRLSFFPSVIAENRGNLKRASIPEKVLTPPHGKLNLKSVSTFATKFNMLASMASSRFGSKSTNSFYIDLTAMPDEFKDSKSVLVIKLNTKDLALSMAIDNLFKVLN